jgi:hypothetical protein
MEEKLRRREILVKEDAMADFYSRRLSGVYDLRGLERRIRSAGGDDFLKMSEKDLLLFFPTKRNSAVFLKRSLWEAGHSRRFINLRRARRPTASP